MSYRVAALSLMIAAVPSSVGAAKVKLGEPAPDFTVKTLGGEKIRLADLRGQVVVLNFWATWCGPCKRELPLLDVAAQTWGKNGLRIFAVTTETSLKPSQMKPLMDALSMTPVRAISGPYAPIGGAIPTNFIIDRKGIVRYAKAAAFDIAALNREIGMLLDEPVPPAVSGNKGD